MKLLEILLDFIARVAWPVTAIVVFLFFRKHIVSLFPFITRLKAGSIEVSMEQKIASIIEETLENKNIQSDIPENLKSIVYQEEATDQGVEIEGNQTNVMLAFTANKSLAGNLKYGIYYDPANRNHNTAFDFIGLYEQHAIVAVGKVSKLVYCNYQDGKLVATNGDNLGKLTTDEYDRIKHIIEETPYYSLQFGCKFFLVEKFYHTDYKKTSKYPLRAKKYFWLTQIEGYNQKLGAQGLSEILKKFTWQ